MFEVGQKVYIITDSLEEGREWKLYEGEVKPSYSYEGNGMICVKFDNGEWIMPIDFMSATAEEALKKAFAKNECQQKKYAEQYQDLIRIEAELNLKGKEEKQNDRERI